MTAIKMTRCPTCGVETGQGKPMQHHLRDKHGLTGMKAHLIANPNDKQAAKTITGRRARSAPKRVISARPSDDFDLIEAWP